MPEDSINECAEDGWDDSNALWSMGTDPEAQLHTQKTWCEVFEKQIGLLLIM